MKRWPFIIAAIGAHAWLSIYSFRVVLGIAHMHPDDRPGVLQAVWGAVVAVTWFPLLWLSTFVRVGGQRASDGKWGVAILILNSVVAVLGVWVVGRALRRWYLCRHRSHA